MVSLMRNGPRMLFIGTSQREKLIDTLLMNFEAETMDIDIIFDKSDAFHTLLYLVPELSTTVKKSEVTDAILIRQDVSKFLCRLFMKVDRRLVDSIRPAPQTIIMRAPADMELMIKKIHTDLGGALGSFEASLESSTEDSTIIGLTDKPLNRSTRLADMHPTFLRLDSSYPLVKRELQMNGLSYVNCSIGKQSWNELEIRIYDSYGAFKPHYERLMLVLDSLELGMVLGEAWSIDHPRVLLAVEVYSLKFFTFKEPQYIKRVLLGLEHLADKTRIVDYDLFHKNKKIYWKETVPGKIRHERPDEALLARTELYAHLDDHTKEELEELEVEILATRRKH